MCGYTWWVEKLFVIISNAMFPEQCCLSKRSSCKPITWATQHTKRAFPHPSAAKLLPSPLLSSFGKAVAVVLAISWPKQQLLA